jgi:ferredoxin
VEVCPVNCFYGDDRMLYINPNECIDCDACVPACPVEAIFALDDVPDDQKQWIQINVDKCAAGTLENFTEKLDPLPTAEAKKTALGL